MSATRSSTGSPETLPIKQGFLHPKTSGFAPKQSQVTLQFAIVSDLRTQGATVSNLMTVVTSLASLLQMNEFELAAWDSLLMKEFKPNDSPSQQVTTLKMTCYHTKSLLCKDFSQIHDHVLLEDPNFSTKYEDWVASHRKSGSLSLDQVHRQYKKMVASTSTLQKVESLNDVVDCIVNTEVEASPVKSEEERIRKSRKMSCASSDSDWFDVPCVSYGQSTASDYPDLQETVEEMELVLCHLTHPV